MAENMWIWYVPVLIQDAEETVFPTFMRFEAGKEGPSKDAVTVSMAIEYGTENVIGYASYLRGNKIS